MGTRAACVIIALAIACKDTPAQAPAPSTAAAPIVIDALVVDALDARCADGCLFLVDTALAGAPGRFTATCGKPWPYSETDCEGLLYARNCIYAAHGNVFKKPEWKARFEAQPWYRPRAGFVESDIPPLAMRNVIDLKRAYEACGLPDVSAADKALVAKILEGVSVTNDALIEVGGVGKTAISNRLRHHVIVDETILTYKKKPTPEKRTIVVENLMHAVGPGELDTATVVAMTFDADGELIAIELQ